MLRQKAIQPQRPWTFCSCTGGGNRRFLAGDETSIVARLSTQTPPYGFDSIWRLGKNGYQLWRKTQQYARPFGGSVTSDCVLMLLLSCVCILFSDQLQPDTGTKIDWWTGSQRLTEIHGHFLFFSCIFSSCSRVQRWISTQCWDQGAGVDWACALHHFLSAQSQRASRALIHSCQQK